MKEFIKKVLYLPRTILVLPIKLYRKYFSGLKATPTCRFQPTCSEYAIEAIKEWGVIIGLPMSVWRVLRCNPFGKGGYDPVPKRKRRGSDA